MFSLQQRSDSSIGRGSENNQDFQKEQKERYEKSRRKVSVDLLVLTRIQQSHTEISLIMGKRSRMGKKRIKTKYLCFSNCG